MPAPVFVDVPAGEAVKVATAVSVGQIHKTVNGGAGATWLATYVPTGDAAPVKADFSGGRIFLDGDTAEISSSELIDVYLWLDGPEAGEVRVDA